jgi:hypothetical protein
MGSDNKDSFSEAILKKKDSINKLIVDDATNDDNSICSMSTTTMEVSNNNISLCNSSEVTRQSYVAK